MREIKCAVCEKKLTGGLDTFGLIGNEQCAPCFLAGDKAEAIKKVKCPDCHGQGEVTHRCDCELCGVTEEECERCGGTGEINEKDISENERKLMRRPDKAQLEKERARLASWNSMVSAPA